MILMKLHFSAIQMLLTCQLNQSHNHSIQKHHLIIIKSAFVLQIGAIDMVSEAILASFHAKIFRYGHETGTV